MRRPLVITLVLFIEVVVLLFIILVLLVGIAGIFLPILPGLLLIAAAAGLYSLTAHNKHSLLTPWLNQRLAPIKNKLIFKKIFTFMGIIKTIQKKKEARIREEILKHGLILFGFNVALVIGFLFGFIGLSIIGAWLDPANLFVFFFPALLIFIFAGLSAIVWYRFGQILGHYFKDRRVVNAALVVLTSFLPLLAVLLLFTAAIGVAGGFSNEFVVVLFLGFVLMSVFSAAFEFLVVSLGVITRRV